MATEVEARFRASGPEPLLALADAQRLGAARLGPSRRVEEIDTYVDTADGSLSAARWACRLRQREGRRIVSLKGPPEAGSGGWLHRRPEVEGPGADGLDPGGWPASEARTLVERLSRGAPLAERFILRQVRVERGVEVDARRIGVLSLDDVLVERAGHIAGRVHVVELELAAAHADAESTLSLLAAALERTEGLVPEPRTKLELAIETIGAG